ncbi:MAG TPA: MlaD family protein [Solirubrobacteraceae bacterium]|jgi:virulence factor Mce-like protein|nr:MlaD family protein [Solirubrobacteraceae bacterium]
MNALRRIPARPALLALLALALAGAALLAVTSARASDEQRYTVVLDNAFGLTEGSDLRSAGVPIGKVEQLDVQRSTARALATIVITKPSFAGFHADVFCEVKPQSLIGEYYMDCDPGTKPGPAPRTIPVQQTAGTIPPDLVLDILRRPARERFGLILTELGSGLTGRGGDIQTTLRRAVPALRETDKVLAILDANRTTINQLTRNADTVLAAIAANRHDVARFVRTAGETTQIAASRASALSATVDKLPRFERELRPTLADLATTARRQTPALRDLRAAAPELTTFLTRLGPFATSARPAVRGLGRAAQTGIPAVKQARSTVKQLRALGAASTEPMRNLRFVLEDVNDRKRAVEPNKLSPTGAGFTGLEALLQYFFVQSQAINIYDSRGYLLKLSLLVNECSQYTDAQSIIDNPQRTARCKQWLGPNQPGINSGQVASGARTQAPAGTGTLTQTPPPGTASAGKKSGGPLASTNDLLSKVLPSNVTGTLPHAPPASQSSSPSSDASARDLLDYLLGP